MPRNWCLPPSNSKSICILCIKMYDDNFIECNQIIKWHPAIENLWDFGSLEVTSFWVLIISIPEVPRMVKIQTHQLLLRLLYLWPFWITRKETSKHWSSVCKWAWALLTYRACKPNPDNNSPEKVVKKGTDTIQLDYCQHDVMLLTPRLGEFLEV